MPEGPEHLRLVAQGVVARKKPRRGGRPRPRRHGDHQAHADELRESIERGLNKRPPKRPFSVDPRAILVVSLNRSIADDVWEGVDMLELDGRSFVATVAFSRRVELSTFLDRLAKHRAATATLGTVGRALSLAVPAMLARASGFASPRMST